MTDAEKCRLIAEFEGVTGQCDGPMHGAQRVCAHMSIVPHFLPLSDYPHDLNATMRAARRLPKGFYLVVESDCAGKTGAPYAGIRRTETKWMMVGVVDADPARAAFEALAAWLMERGK